MAADNLLKEGPVVLFIVSTHTPQLTPNSCGTRKICVLDVPSTNTTHPLQPVDVGVYGPVKNAWKEVIKSFKTRTLGAEMTKRAFPGKTL